MGADNNHYNQPRLLETILAKFQELGIGENTVTRDDIAAMDEFHLQGAAVSQELASKLNLTPDIEVLDVGCGIGGACRMIADEFSCSVVGLDYTPEYIRTARVLTHMIGLSDKVVFQEGNALHLPFENQSFEVVWTQHAQMNIANKEQFYAEIQRVLKPGGRFLYYDIFSADQGEIYYPVPWAEHPQNSHLITHEEVTSYFIASEYRREITENHTQRAIAALNAALEQAYSGNAPSLGLNILMQQSTGEKLTNLLKCLSKQKIEVHAGIYAKNDSRLS